MLDSIGLPHLPVWYLFVICISDRDQFRDYLKQKMIGTLIHYPIPPIFQKPILNQDIHQEIIRFRKG